MLAARFRCSIIDSFATIFSAIVTKFCEWSHWWDHCVAQLISAAISVAYAKNQTAKETQA